MHIGYGYGNYHLPYRGLARVQFLKKSVFILLDHRKKNINIDNNCSLG